jgi:hypothetical protein
MILNLSRRFGLFCSAFASLVLPGGVFGAFITLSEGGDATTASIQDTVDIFRAVLGNPNNGNAPGPLDSGRREINWDGGGNTTSVSGTSFDGFLNIRGARFTTPGTGFIQAPPTGGPQGGFDTFFSNPNLSSTFGVFSAQRIFSPISSNITDVSFFIPGANPNLPPGANPMMPATVSGFGAVFTDVDLDDSTRIQFFDTSNKLIFDQAVPAGTVSSKSFSFLGATGNAGEQISRVRIISGNTPIASSFVNDQVEVVDAVAMDDFIYAEPVPEPRVIGLIGLGLSFVLFRRRRCLVVS